MFYKGPFGGGVGGGHRWFARICRARGIGNFFVVAVFSSSFFFPFPETFVTKNVFAGKIAGNGVLPGPEFVQFKKNNFKVILHGAPKFPPTCLF